MSIELGFVFKSISIILIFSIWWHNRQFVEPIQPFPSFSNEPRREIIRIMETSRINSINRGGDLGKAGPGPRAKADALKKAGKARSRSIFAEGLLSSDN